MKRRDFLKSMTAIAAGGALPAAPAVWSPARAQARQETLLIVSESGPNNIDIHGVGTNVPGYEVSWNCYDRLISHEMKYDENGTPYYDRDRFKPELADDMKIGDMSVTFTLKKNAVFHDGTPVTANDVKWSLDRAVTVGGFPTFQMGAGSLTKPEQFVVVDDRTIRVDFLKKDRLTIPDLAVIVPCVLNSELVKKHATEKDPWGLEYTKQNTAGSGAYRVANWTPGTEVVYERNDKWTGGPLPKVRRVVWRIVPSSGNRRALLERGDADISYDLPNKDFSELKKLGKLSIVSTPFSNGIQTTLSFDLGFAGVNEPLCVLTQESLAQIGIKTTINKVPGANWRTELNKKTLPLYVNVFSGWLDYPEYFFIWCYHGQNSVFNTMSYQSKDMDKLIEGARDAAAVGKAADYEKNVKGFVDLAFADMPRVPLVQPYVTVAMQKNISGYQYWFHRRLDYRALAKG